MQALVPGTFLVLDRNTLMVSQQFQGQDGPVTQRVEMFVPDDVVPTLQLPAPGTAVLVEVIVGQKKRDGGGYNKAYKLVKGLKAKP